MKISHTQYELFINHFIILNKDSKVSSNQIHTLFCSVFDLNPTNFSIKSFMTKFINVYEKLKGEKLIRSKQRFDSHTNSVRCVLGISLTPIDSFSQLTSFPQFSTQLGTTNTTNTEHNTERSRNNITPLLSSIITNDGTIKEHYVERSVEYKGTRISLSTYMKTFQPGTEKYSLKFLVEDYKNFYKESPLHLEYITSTADIRKKFNLHWNLQYPNHDLDNKARKGENSDYAIGGLKKL